MTVNWLMWAFTAALFWSLGPIFAKIGLEKSDPFSALLARTLGVFLVLLLIGIGSGKIGRLQELDSRTWLLLVAEGLAASVIAHFAYFKALSLGYVSQVSPIVASYPLLAMLLAAGLLNDPLTLQRVIGGAMVIGGIFLIQR